MAIERKEERRMGNVIEKYLEKGFDVRIVGSVFGVCGHLDLGFYAVIEKGKISPENLAMADKLWRVEAIEGDSVHTSEKYKKTWEEAENSGLQKTWWTTNGEDATGYMETLADYLEENLWDFLKSGEIY